MSKIMDINELLNINPYSLQKDEKTIMLTSKLKELTKMHYSKSEMYKKMMDAIDLKIDSVESYLDIPFLPVRMFKELELLSISKDDVIKTMTSSGTTSQQVSKIFLDRETSANQTKVLTKIVSNFIGNKRVPMLILDTSAVLKDRNMFSARGAGILGFSMFGSKRFYALDENMQLDIEGIQNFLKEHKGETILMFGFTFMIWKHFYTELIRSGFQPDLSKGVLIHGGGWKKLQNEAVSQNEFKNMLHHVCGIGVNHIHDYYGMVEQTGTIYMECENGHFHTSIFSDIIVRRPDDFSIADIGEAGIIEVVSLLPKSYPGHALLTEDEGIVLGEDDCSCGRFGKYFKVAGRIKKAEIRGCSDTYATN